MDEIRRHPWVTQGGPPSFARASQTEDVAANEAANELTFSDNANTVSERIGSHAGDDPNSISSTAAGHAHQLGPVRLPLLSRTSGRLARLPVAGIGTLAHNFACSAGGKLHSAAFRELCRGH